MFWPWKYRKPQDIGLIVKKMKLYSSPNKNKKTKICYVIVDIEDERMTRRQINILLLKLGVSITDVAMMWEEFREHPKYTHAEFGMNGYFTIAY